MKKKETVDERLTRLNNEFDALLKDAGVFNNESYPEVITPIKLTRFGLTLNEARSWLKREPNYLPADEKKHYFRTDDKEPVPARAFQLFLLISPLLPCPRS